MRFDDGLLFAARVPAELLQSHPGSSSETAGSTDPAFPGRLVAVLRHDGILAGGTGTSYGEQTIAPPQPCRGSSPTDALG